MELFPSKIDVPSADPIATRFISIKARVKNFSLRTPLEIICCGQAPDELERHSRHCYQNDHARVSDQNSRNQALSMDVKLVSLKSIHRPEEPEPLPNEVVAHNDNAADYPHDLECHYCVWIS